MTVAAIHQPNFFPWLGYFRKIARADVFVFLDDVQFPRGARGCWTNRVKIMSSTGADWATCPVSRNSTSLINQTRIADDGRWRGKLIRRLESAYSKKPFFSENKEFCFRLIHKEIACISEYNISNIMDIANYLDMSTAFVKSSQLNLPANRLKGSDLLSAICVAVQAQTYLAGDGAEGYEDADAYDQAGLSYRRNNFVHPVYDQGGATFQAGLSVFDALFCCGRSAVGAMLAVDDERSSYRGQNSAGSR